MATQWNLYLCGVSFCSCWNVVLVLFITVRLVCTMSTYEPNDYTQSWLHTRYQVSFTTTFRRSVEWWWIGVVSITDIIHYFMWCNHSSCGRHQHTGRSLPGWKQKVGLVFNFDQKKLKKTQQSKRRKKNLNNFYDRILRGSSSSLAPPQPLMNLFTSQINELWFIVGHWSDQRIRWFLTILFFVDLNYLKQVC